MTEFNALGSSVVNQNTRMALEQFIQPISLVSRISQFAQKHHCFLGFSSVLTGITLASTVKFIWGAGHVAFPIAGASALLVSIIIYIGYNRFKTKELEEVDPQLTDNQEQEEIIKQLDSLPFKSEEEIQKDLDEAISKIADEIKRSPIVQDERINDRIVELFNTLGTAGLNNEILETKKQKIAYVINNVKINRELKDRKFVIGDNSREIQILKKLGHNINELSPYRDKELLYSIIQHVVDHEFTRDPTIKATIPQNILKARLNEIALRTRLETIEIKGPKVNKFQIILDFDKKVYDTCQDRLESLEFVLPVNIDAKKNPMTVRQFHHDLHSKKKYAPKSKSLSFIGSDNIKTYFTDDQYKVSAFQAKLSEKFETIVENSCKYVHDVAQQKAGSQLQKLAQFFDKWSKNLIVEVFQGMEDANEALVDGVCYAFNLILETDSRDNPDYDLDQLNIKIEKSHRITQALYELMAKMVGTKLGDGKLIHAMRYNKGEFNRKINHVLPDADKSHGWLVIPIVAKNYGGHDISFRIDKSRNKVWLIDSNTGCFKFNTKNPDDFGNALVNCLECFDDLMQAYYSKFTVVGIMQRT